LLIYSILMSYLLVAEFPLMAFKFKSWGWAANQLRYLFLIYCVAILLMLKFAAFPILVVSYIVLSFILSLLNIKQK
jgi:CDP-diacylglycerol--serine O-phosphatidyltransferase